MNHTGIIMAGGNGTRFHSEIPKPLYPIYNRPMIENILDVFLSIGIKKVIIIVNNATYNLYNDFVVNYTNICRSIEIILVIQKEALGTFHAVSLALSNVTTKYCIVIPGDKPLVNPQDIVRMFKHDDHSILGYKAVNKKPILVDNNGYLLYIIEDYKDINENYRQYDIRTGGVYCFLTAELRRLELDVHIQKNNNKNEYYLTDVFKHFNKKTKIVEVDVESVSNVNTINDANGCFTYLNSIANRSGIGKAYGRVNLMGRHIDHQGGHCNAILIDKYITTTIETLYTQYSLISLVQNDKGKLSRSVYDMKLLNTIPESWAKYPLNCLKYLETNNIIKLTNGLKITVDGNIPQGAGLSSSSALVISIIRACIDYFSLKVSNENIIEWADEIERMVGTNGGLGDQTIITIGDINKIIKYTCLNGIHIDDIVNFPENLRVSLFYTGVKADKGSKLQNIFNYKVSLYDKGLKQLDKDRLDNVTFDDLKLLSDDTKPIITYGLREMRRAENFIYTIKNTDYKTLTNMVNESQQDEVLLYRCSCKEADFIVNIANNIDGVYGAQICGAGMGGTVAVFDNGKINVKEIIENYGFKYITCIS